MPLNIKTKVLVVLALVLCRALPSALADSVSYYLGVHDLEYLRIQRVVDSAFIYADQEGHLNYAVDGGDARDLRSHWYLEPALASGSYWIRNRLTGEALQADGQTGPLKSTDPAQRWIFEPAPPHFLLRTASQLPEQAQIVDLDALPRGAMLPWISYDEENYNTLTEPAHVDNTSYNAGFERFSPAAEAQKNACIVLNGFGTRVEWTVKETANALSIRYSVQDGSEGTITLTLRPQGGGSDRVIKVPVTSNQAWVYFDGGTEHDNDAPGRLPAKRFAEARVLLDAPVQAGDTLRLSRESGDELIWIDVVELESTTEFIPSDISGYYDVTSSPWNAKGDGVSNDYFALVNCLNDAANAGKQVYLPAGRYNIPYELILPEGTGLQGAGMWHSELFFSGVGGQTSGGVRADGNNMTLRDLYIEGSQTTRSNGYKGIKGNWGTGSLIENVWIENTETGMWIADYYGQPGVTDGLVVRNCRIRNTFADGINMAEGTVNTVVENCHFRSTGDDALASWASGKERGFGPTQNQRFRYNTIECGYRAGGIGIFGGGAHRIHHNVVSDQYIAAGIRLNSVFIWVNGSEKGHPFNESGEPIRIYDNTLIRTGARSLFNEETAAIDLVIKDADVQNIWFRNIVIDQSQFTGIRFEGYFTQTSPAPEFRNLSFENIQMREVPFGTRATNSARGSASYRDVSVATGVNDPSLNRNFILTQHNSLEDWQVLHFGSPDSPAAALGADPNGNGIPNLFEFASGMDPKSAVTDKSKLPQVELVRNGEQTYMQFSFHARSGGGNGDALSGYAIDGISWLPQVSTTASFGDWTSGGSVIQQFGSRINNGDGTESITYRLADPDPVSAFARLKVKASTAP
ncbi:hypothetical protein G0Q06_10085 [Puniceicoccales bacterium CK1056]|uniref:Uncharacterized protein n=1 Tax=Oceanipulchritudo coccoides TaxID=2706888 RepID=A0A6B2M3L7_9BACT|nr:glycosyl hydrolase family 28-related protein [Oceanipulchritudo coccoides]NDV62799.1 hypothetical protein [Oceanipulchritudo coccoides]